VEPKLGTFSTLSIGIGGMVGGGIFAVTGLTVEVTKGSAPIAFLIAGLVAGLVALLTSYSYLKLTLRYPGEGAPSPS
jgi:amino acid transporter